MTVIDVGGQVRHGEELDISAVETWLKDLGVELQGQAQVTQYSGGASNWTYRLEYDNVDSVRGMDIIFVTSAKSDEEARELLNGFDFPFNQ